MSSVIGTTAMRLRAMRAFTESVDTVGANCRIVASRIDASRITRPAEIRYVQL